MKKNNKTQLGIVLISIITAAVAYSYLPESVASHWNYLGQPDAYSSKLTNLIAFPALIVFLFVLLRVVPKMDPLKKNIESESYDSLITMMGVFFLIIQYFLILWNMGIQVPVTVLFPTMLALLFYFIGNMLEDSKRNWTVGIKTTWTLSSDKVWEKTHKLGAKLFKASVPVLVLSMLIPSITFIVTIGYILGITIFLVAYSYFEYRKEESGK